MNSRHRTLFYESLENRTYLSTNPITASSDGLLLYSGGDLVLNSNSSTSEIGEYWLETNMEASWETLATGDFTGDGISDLYGQFQNERVGLQVNDGQQLFFKYWGENVPKSARIVGQGDVNNDGLLDIVSFDDGRNELWVSVNNLELGFNNYLWGVWSNVNWDQIIVGDFDRDGFADVLGGERSGGWRLAKSDGARFHNQAWGSYPDYSWQNVVPGDFNGDQFIDVAARAPDNTWWVWSGSDSGFSPAKYSGHWKMSPTWHNVQVADFDADGKDDLIGRSEDGRLWVGTSDEAGFHTWNWATGWIDAADWQTIVVADIDGNGLPEQIGEAADGTWWYAENLEGTFRNHFLGRGFRLIGTVSDFRSDTLADLSAVFGNGVSEMETSDNLAERNRNSYQMYVSTFEDSYDPTINVEPIEFSIDEAGKLVIHQSKEGALAIKIDSPSRSIVTGTSPAPFDDFLVNDAGSVLLIRHGSEPVEFANDTTLDLGWTGSEDPPALQYYNVRDHKWYPVTSTRESSSSLVVQPAELDPANTTKEVTDPLVVSRNDENKIIVTGTGQLVAGGINFRSPSHALIPGTSPSPMDFFLNNSAAAVTIALLPGTTLTIDGSLTLDLRWDDKIDFQELLVEYGLAKSSDTFEGIVKS